MRSRRPTQGRRRARSRLIAPHGRARGQRCRREAISATARCWTRGQVSGPPAASGEPVTDDYPGDLPYRFTEGTSKQVAVDVSGEPDLMRWLNGRQGSARPLPSPESGSPLSPARREATPNCCRCCPSPRTGYGSVGQRPGKGPLTCGDGVGLRGLEPRTSSLSDPTTNYADVIRGCELLWRIMGNAQVEAIIDPSPGSWSFMVLPHLLRSPEERLLPVCCQCPLTSGPGTGVNGSQTGPGACWPRGHDATIARSPTLAGVGVRRRRQPGRYTSMSTARMICWISSSAVYSPGRGGGASHGKRV